MVLKDIDENCSLAIQYIEQAAKQGHAGAQYNLGCMIRHGVGCTADPQKAMHWFMLAAQQGDADSEYNLGAISG